MKFSPTEDDFLTFIDHVMSDNVIKEACFYLEKKYVLNINILLLCCWAAQRGCTILDRDDICTMLDRITPWHLKIIAALEQLESSIKKIKDQSTFTEMQHLISHNKTLSQRVEQSFMAHYIVQLDRNMTQKENTLHTALNSIFNYIRYQQVTLHQNDLEKVYHIVKVCCEPELKTSFQKKN